MRRPQLRFELEVEVVTGEEGRELRLAQARAIRDILMWLQQENAATSSDPRSTGSGRAN
jgi:hypothetical protein